MDILIKVKEYVNNGAQNDVAELKNAIDRRLPGTELFSTISPKPMSGGMFPLNALNSGNKTKNMANKMTNTRKNTNKTRTEEQKYRTCLLFSIVVLGSLAHLRGHTPFIHSFIEILKVYKSTAYDTLIVPFMGVMQKSFSFFNNDLSLKVKEGIYLKMLATFTGDDILNDPNKVMTTMVNVSKILVFMVTFMSPLLQKPYTPSVTPINATECNNILLDIIKVLNETYKGMDGFTFMVVPDKSILMIRNTDGLKETKEVPK
jgi:hypothetical protein